jgi:hypothetical protein
MPYNVQLPDGRIVEGIPDDVSQLDAKKRILEAFPEIAAKEKRGWGEAITDVGASLASGVGALAQVPGQLTQLTGLTKAEDANKGLQGLGKQLEEFGQESKSAVLKGKEAVRAQKIDQAEGMLAEFGIAIKETIRDPALLTSFFAEQLPNLAGSWGGGLLARGATKALMAEATGAALGKAGVRGAIGTGAVMQGADIGSETYEAAYKEAKKQGMDDEQANGIALSKGRVAGIEAAMLSLAVTKLPGGATIEKAMAGKGLPTVGGFSRGLFGEAVSEGLEEGGGKFASNVGVQEVNPETSLTKGVGSAAGMGALGGGFFGGVAGYTESRAKAMEDKRAEIEAARNKAMETGETQTLALPYDPNVNAQPIMYVYPDGTMAFPSEANNFANENAQELSQEALEEQYAPQRVPEVITPNSLKEMGFAAKGGKPFQEVRASLIGKDIRDPAQAAEVKTILENYAEKTTSTKTIEGITKFLERPEFQPAPVEEVIAEPKKRERKPKVVAEQPVVPEEVAQEVVKPKRRMKALKPTAEELLSIQEQDLIRQELEDEQAALNQQSARETPTAISGSSEPSVRVPSDGVTTPTGTDQSQRRGMVPVGNDVGQPIGGAAPVQRALEEPAKPLLLEPAATLSTRHAKEYKEAAANYLEKANYIGQRALENVAGDLYTGENLKDAKRFHRGLSEGQKGFVQKKLDELNKYERRGTAYNEARTAQQNAKAAFEEELDQEAETKAEVKAEPKKKAKKANPKLERIDAGKTTDALTNAVAAGNLNAALNAIAKDTSDTFNILEKLVSSRLLANKGSLPKIEIVPAGTIQDGAAQYNPFTDTVQINEGEVDSHTVLHETVHGFLHALITKFEGEAGVKNKGISDLKELYEFIKRTEPGLVKEYGMESLTEFASELMSNRQFQETLAQIPYRVETQSLFTAFIRAVLNALGLSPTQKLSALASGLIAADRTLALGRKIQEDVVTGKETMPTVKVVRTADLDTLYKATGAGSRAKPTVATGPFQAAKETFRDTAAAKQGLARFLNTAETMLFSADAALNNAIRKGLESGGRSWDTIKQMMYDISTAQATHADAVAMQFLEKGNVVYDEQVRKWIAKDNKDSWAGLVNQISDLAKKYDVEFETMNNYAQEAFVAERLKGLSKSKQEVFSHKTPAQIEAGVKFFDMIPELRDVQKSWNAVRKNAMDVAVQGGLYSEEQAKELLDIMDYVPFYRIEQLAQNAGPKEYGRGLIDFAKGYKIAGSEQEVANIFDNMERWTSYTVSRAVKNRTALNLKNAAEQFLPEGEVVKLRQDERVHREQNTIDIWENGQRTKYEFKDPLFVHAFNGLEAAAIPHFGAASAVANFLRKNIVLMPLFSISQLSQDSFGAMLTSGLKHPWLLPLEVAKEFVNTLRGRSAAAKELTKYGAVGVRDYSATMVRDTAEIMAGLKQNTKTGKFKQALENFAMASDNAVRQAIYNMTMKETGDKALAVERAFEIINFKRAGASGKIQMMRQVVPFFGAYLQAQNVVYKTLSGKGITPQQKKEAHRVLISNALKISALAFMYAAIASDDEDYQKMDPQIRDRHLLIPGTAFMLPMRSDLTLMPKLIAEYAYLGMTDNAFTDGKKIRRAMGTALFNAVASPTAVPQLFKPGLEVATNYDFFTGRSIIGQGIANKLTEEQYTNNTSELAKLLGKTGMIAPVNVDHLIKGYLGTTGGLALQLTSAIINSTKDQPRPEKSWRDAIATTPGLSAFVAREYGNADKNDFYELRGEVDKVNNTINSMRKQGRVEEAKELLAENKDLLKTRTQISNINNQLSKLREYENHVYSLPEARMDAEKKGVEIKRIREQEKKLLANVNGLRRTAGY